MFFVAQSIGVAGAPRVFEVGAQRCIGQPHAAVELVILQLREHTQTLGIAFEVEKIATLLVSHVVQPAAPGCLLEPVTYRILAAVAERRIADVVGQARGLHQRTEVAGFTPRGQFAAQRLAHPQTQRATHAAHLQRMGQARVNVVVAGDRVHLRLAPQAAEGARENDAIMVFVKWAAAQFFGAILYFSEALAIQQAFPIQG